MLVALVAEIPVAPRSDTRMVVAASVPRPIRTQPEIQLPMKHLNPFRSFLTLAPLLALMTGGASLFAAEAKSTNAPAVTAKKPAPIRIMAALNEPLKDEAGVTWSASEGFADGDSMDRPGLKIENTKTPSIYCSERFGMSKFVKEIPNGDYVVKLHFAITYESISGAGQVVFDIKAEDHEVTGFDLWEKAGGALRAYVETIPVKVADGKLDLTFANQGTENATISAIEILPAP